MKLGGETFALAVKIPVGNAYIKFGFGSPATDGFDDDTRIVARRPRPPADGPAPA